MRRYISIIIAVVTLNCQIADACTVIAIGKKASKDGSVIISHTDAGPDCRIHVVPGRTFKKGSMANVYWGMVDLGRSVGDYGEVIGQIPQVKRTYTYFQSAYPQMNEHQLAIGESTLSQREELKVSGTDCKQIMTIEQAQAFALQRCTRAKDAVKIIASLMDKYGFLPSCIGESESLVIGDTDEIWVFEVFSVGNNWAPESGKPGAIWAAQRVADDQVLIIPNHSIIKQININDKDNFMASSNYMQEAIDRGWYNPDSGKPFIWQEVYSPIPHEWSTSRFWLFYSQVSSELKDIPNRETTNPFAGDDQYTQAIEPLSVYPFSVKPKQKMGVKDVMAFQRSTFTGTIYDKENAPAWYYPDNKGKLVKSAIATPFPTKEMRQVMKINSRRNVARARGEYGMIAQLRGWLPDEVGGIYWYYTDNAYTSAYTPIYAGVTEIENSFKTYNKEVFDNNSYRWCVDFVDNLLYLRWQDAVKDLHEVRDPLENSFFTEQSEIDKRATELLRRDKKRGKQYLTKITTDRMKRTRDMFEQLRYTLIGKYTNNKQGI